MSDLIVKDDWWFRVQMDVPQNGNLGEDQDEEYNPNPGEVLTVQVCHRYGLYIANEDGSPDNTQMVGVVPGDRILNIPTVNKLKNKYPKLVECLKYLQYVAIVEGSLALNPPPPPEPEPIPTPEPEPAPTPSPTPEQDDEPIPE